MIIDPIGITFYDAYWPSSNSDPAKFVKEDLVKYANIQCLC